MRVSFSRGPRLTRPGLLSRLPMNLPNSITMSRILCVPVLLWILSRSFPLRDVHGGPELVAATLFLLAAATDGFDGWLARRRNQITTMGILLDPLADKLLIASAYIALVAYTPDIVPVWIAVVIIGREFLVSGLRSIAATEGFTVAASDVGKLKTVVQIVSVTTAILAHRWAQFDIGWFTVSFHFIAVLAVYWVAIVSVVSAIDYFIGFWRRIDKASESTRRAGFVLRRNKGAVENTTASSITTR
jgi:CDP-diacylglycerol---glycerol-3-phosphate 3-phosphatidyltransferase